MSDMILGIAFMKGGVMKSVSALNIGAYYAKMREKRVLLIDADYQASLSSFFMDFNQSFNGLDNVLDKECEVSEAIYTTNIPNLSLMPSTPDLAVTELNMTAVPARELVLKRLLNPLQSTYDIIIIDCPPSLQTITQNAIIASTHVITPIGSDQLSIWSMRIFKTMYNMLVETKFNPDLRHIGYYLTLFDKRLTVCSVVEEQLRQAFGDDILQTKISVYSKMKELSLVKKDIFQYEEEEIREPEKRKGSLEFEQLVKEIESRL